LSDEKLHVEFVNRSSMHPRPRVTGTKTVSSVGLQIKCGQGQGARDQGRTVKVVRRQEAKGIR
jgi:hypothetical protein